MSHAANLTADSRKVLSRRLVCSCLHRLAIGNQNSHSILAARCDPRLCSLPARVARSINTKPRDSARDAAQCNRSADSEGKWRHIEKAARQAGRGERIAGRAHYGKPVHQQHVQRDGTGGPSQEGTPRLRPLLLLQRRWVLLAAAALPACASAHAAAAATAAPQRRKRAPFPSAPTPAPLCIRTAEPRHQPKTPLGETPAHRQSALPMPRFPENRCLGILAGIARSDSPIVP